MLKKFFTFAFALSVIGVSNQVHAQQTVGASMRGEVTRFGTSSYVFDYGTSATESILMGNHPDPMVVQVYRGAFEFNGFADNKWITDASFVFANLGTVDGDLAASTVTLRSVVGSDFSTFGGGASALFAEIGSGNDYGSQSGLTLGSNASSNPESVAFNASAIEALNIVNYTNAGGSDKFQLGTTHTGGGFVNIPTGGLIQLVTTGDVDNAAPTAVSDSLDYEINEGEFASISALLSSDTNVTAAHGDALTYSWDFVDDSFDIENNLTGMADTNVFNTAGVFDGTLTVTDRWGASSSQGFTITVVPEPGTILSFGLAAAAVGFRRRRRVA